MRQFTHLDQSGKATMVDISAKDATVRTATACGRIKVNQDIFQAIAAQRAEKGDVFAVARVAGIMAAKRTWELIPLCHSLALTDVQIAFHMCRETWEVEAVCTAKCVGKTGVEMEALTGVNVALLTIYDMCKAMGHDMVIGPVYLAEKNGGKSGRYVREGESL